MNTYRNFNGLYTATPKHMYHPLSLDDLINIVRKSNHVRVIGSTHVFNDMSITNDSLISMDKLNNIIFVDTVNKLVTVESGAILSDVLDQLATYGITLPVMTATNNISIAGGPSTGSHGSHSNHGSMSSLIQRAQLVTPDGSVIHIDNTSKFDPDMLRAIRCSLGCLGAIYSVTLQCVDMYSIRKREVNTTWPHIYHKLSKILKAHQYTDINIDPHSDIDNLVAILTLKKKVAYDEALGPGYNELTSDVTSLYIEIELAFALEMADEAVRAVCSFHQQYKRKHHFHTDDYLYVRFSDADDTLLSMASGRKTIHISTFFGIKQAKRVNKFMHKLSDKMVKKYGARPHYGKQHGLTIEQMKKLYGDNYDRFANIKQTLDPAGKFSNEYIRRLFA